MQIMRKTGNSCRVGNSFKLGLPTSIRGQHCDGVCRAGMEIMAAQAYCRVYQTRPHYTMQTQSASSSCLESGKGRFGYVNPLRPSIFSTNKIISKLCLSKCPDFTFNRSLSFEPSVGFSTMRGFFF